MNSIVLQEVKPGMHAQLIHTHRQFKVQYICHNAVAILELLSNYSIYGVAQRLYGGAH